MVKDGTWKQEAARYELVGDLYRQAAPGTDFRKLQEQVIQQYPDAEDQAQALAVLVAHRVAETDETLAVVPEAVATPRPSPEKTTGSEEATGVMIGEGAKPGDKPPRYPKE